jgi:DUF4097 and DUF4098 domain-containing protein YvlB
MDGNDNNVASGTPPHDGRGVGPDGAVRFDAAPGLVLDVRTASGDVRVSGSGSSACELRFTTNDADPARRLSLVECTYDAATNRVTVDTKAGQFSAGDGASGLKKTLTRLFDTVRHDVDVEVRVPEGSTVRFRTASGDLRSDVSVSGLDVSSASGDVSCGPVTGALKFQSASGDVAAGGVSGSVEVKTASGDVRLGPVGGALNVHTVSGDVSFVLESPVEARVNTVSGDVQAGVVTGLLLELDANTVSGELSSEIALDGAGSGASEERVLHVKVRTVSGDVKVQRA